MSETAKTAAPSTRQIIVEDRRIGREGFRAFREQIGQICSPSPLGDPDTFEARSRSAHMGTVIITDMQSSSLLYHRSARQLEQSAYDHFQINFVLAGDMQLRSRGRTTTVRRGDIGLLDTVRAADVQVQGPTGGLSHCMSMFVPRTLAKAALFSPHNQHGAVLRRETRAGRLTNSLLASLAQNAGQLSPLETDIQVQGLLALLGSGLGCNTDTALPLRLAMQMAMLCAAKRHIDQHLDSPRLSPATLARGFGCSRATLYRLFEADGGLVKYVQRRRLQRAYVALISPHQAHRRILDIALDSHFASDATFNRAFRRTYGVPPGELRELARARLALNQDRAPAPENRGLAVHWIQQLREPSIADAIAAGPMS